MSNKVTPATLSTQKELISALNSQSILLQLSYAENKSIPKIKQELMQQLFYVSQETALKAKFDFQTNSTNTLLAEGKWVHTKPYQYEQGEEFESAEDDEDEMEVEEDHILEEDGTESPHDFEEEHEPENYNDSSPEST